MRKFKVLDHTNVDSCTGVSGTGDRFTHRWIGKVLEELPDPSYYLFGAREVVRLRTSDDSSDQGATFPMDILEEQREDKFQPGDVVDWVKSGTDYWSESVIIARKDREFADRPEWYKVRNKHDGGIGMIPASELVLHEEAALNSEPKGKFFILSNEPENPDAPTMKELSEAQDISGYTTSFEFTRMGDSLDATSMLGEWQESEDEEDVISSPSHYTEGMPEGLEVRDIIKAQGFWKEFCAGNVIKYSLRWQYKNGIEDLKKMLQYGQWLAEELEDEHA